MVLGSSSMTKDCWSYCIENQMTKTDIVIARRADTSQRPTAGATHRGWFAVICKPMSALYPGQAGAAPTADATAMATSVLVPLEPLQDIEAVGVTGLGRGYCCVVRPRTGAA